MAKKHKIKTGIRSHPGTKSFLYHIKYLSLKKSKMSLLLPLLLYLLLLLLLLLLLFHKSDTKPRKVLGKKM